MIQAVLWDNDGVLVDSEALFFDVTRQCFASAGVSLAAEVWALRYLGDGQRSRDIGLDLGLPESDIDSLLERRNAAFRERLESPVPVLPGAAETVQALHGRVRQVIVTGASREHVNRTHRHTGLLRFFEAVIASDDYELVKPHPDAYLTALRRLGIAAGDAIAVEDSPRGAHAALAAGLRCVAVPTPLSRLAQFPDVAIIVPDARAVADLVRPRKKENPPG